MELPSPPANSSTSDLLSRVRSFLPVLQEANQQLAENDDDAATMDPAVLEDDSDDDEQEEADDKHDDVAAAETKDVAAFTLKLKPDATDDDGDLGDSCVSPLVKDATTTTTTATNDDEVTNSNGDNLLVDGNEKRSAVDDLLKLSPKEKRQRGPLIQELT